MDKQAYKQWQRSARSLKWNGVLIALFGVLIGVGAFCGAGPRPTGIGERIAGVMFGVVLAAYGLYSHRRSRRVRPWWWTSNVSHELNRDEP